MTISDDELDALIDAEAKATKGPWQAHHWQVTAGVNPAGDGLVTLFRYADSLANPCQSDTTFIALLRNAAPSLLAELRASREMIAKLHEALTPSAETKAAYIGEFSFDETPDDHFGGPVTRTVPWTTIKEIMAKIRDRAALASKGER